MKSVELERLIAEGITLIERQNTFELMRDQAAEHYERHVGKPWLPRSGSKVNHRNLTAAMIDSRDFLMAKKRADQEVLLPPGPKIVVTGGLDFNDHRLIWAKLDQVHEKHPDMVLIHGKSPKGAEKIASLWAKNRNVPQIGFGPYWTKHGRAAPFKRNDDILEIVPKGVMHFPAPASTTTSPTRPRSSASRSGSSAARKRRLAQVDVPEPQHVFNLSLGVMEVIGIGQIGLHLRLPFRDFTLNALRERCSAGGRISGRSGLGQLFG